MAKKQKAKDKADLKDESIDSEETLEDIANLSEVKTIDQVIFS